MSDRQQPSDRDAVDAPEPDAPSVHRNVTRVIEAGRALGVEVRPRSYPQGAKTAADAAAAIGCEVGQIVKSLIFGVERDGRDDLELVLAYVSGSNLLDEERLATASGATRCVRVDADTVRSATGFPIGGVPPFGHETALAVFVDPDLLDHDEVWAAAGTWNDVFPISPDQLVAASGGLVTPLKRS